MEGTERCQSCGMPVGPGAYGTDAEGADAPNFCMRCFKNGAFTDPDLTLEDMLAQSKQHMMTELHFDEAKAHAFAYAIIPNLKRWSETIA